MNSGWDDQVNGRTRMRILSDNNKNILILCITSILVTMVIGLMFYGIAQQVQMTNRKFIEEGYEYKPVIEKEVDTEIDTTMSWVKISGEDDE